jgi:hypothetical protein
MPIEASFVEMLSSVGGTMAALLCSFWYIKFLTDNHRIREELWISKDTEADKALRELQATSNAQLLSVLQSVNETLKNMTVAISELKSTMENSRK